MSLGFVWFQLPWFCALWAGRGLLKEIQVGTGESRKCSALYWFEGVPGGIL